MPDQRPNEPVFFVNYDLVMQYLFEQRRGRAFVMLKVYNKDVSGRQKARPEDNLSSTT